MDIERAEQKQEQERKNVRGLQLMILSLASLGIVYGDIGTSSLYVMSSVFVDKTERPSDMYIFGVFSTIFWVITLMVLVKYVWMTLAIDDHGEGGVFALYSIIRRAVKEKSIDFGLIDGDEIRESKTRIFLEKSKMMRRAIFVVTVLCAALTMSDGVLTPAISVLSAAEGIKFHTAISHDAVVGITVGILTALFAFQFLGTKKIGITFGPLMLLWFAFNFSVGVYNITKMPEIFKAISPHYMYYYWSEFGFFSAFKTLGAILLAITGVEALYADMGHLNASSIRVSFTFVVYPSLVITYLGQTAVLMNDYATAPSMYWSSIPQMFIWPSVVIATCATIIASQALITGTFTVVQQAIHANMLPRMTIRQTSADHAGQIYIPAVNLALFAGSVATVLIFGDSIKIANAYGFAVAIVIFLTHIIFCVVMSLLGKNRFIVFVFSTFFGIISTMFLASTAMKVPHGAWFSLAIGAALSSISFIWHRGYRLKIRYTKRNRVMARELFTRQQNNTNNVVFYNEISGGVIPAFRQVTSLVPISGAKNIMLQVRKTAIPRVPDEQRFLVTIEDGVYWVVARYGYAEKINHGADFSRKLCDVVGAESCDVVFVVSKTHLAAASNSNVFKKMFLRVYSFFTFISLAMTKSFGTPRNRLITFEAVYEV
jgi:KUP system potassium uptake protein